MTEGQKAHFARKVVELAPTEFHHGDCVGADADAHRIVRSVLPECRIIGHPPSNPSNRAFCEFDEVWAEKDYSVRNRDIVDATDELWAAPKRNVIEARSGTWSTYRYAGSIGRPRTVIER